MTGLLATSLAGSSQYYNGDETYFGEPLMLGDPASRTVSQYTAPIGNRTGRGVYDESNGVYDGR